MEQVGKLQYFLVWVADDDDANGILGGLIQGCAGTFKAQRHLERIQTQAKSSWQRHKCSCMRQPQNVQGFTASFGKCRATSKCLWVAHV